MCGWSNAAATGDVHPLYLSPHVHDDLFFKSITCVTALSTAEASRKVSDSGDQQTITFPSSDSTV